MAPFAERHPRFPPYKPLKAAIAHRQLLRPFVQRTAAAGRQHNFVRQLFDLGIAADRHMQMFNRHLRQFVHHHRRQTAGRAVGGVILRQRGEVFDDFTQHRTDLQRTALVRHAGIVRLDEQQINIHVAHRPVAVLHPAGDPDGVAGRHHPVGLGDLTHQTAAQRQDQLAFAVVMKRHIPTRFRGRDMERHRLAGVGVGIELLVALQ
ncbi:hypothetical protein GGER_45270 [Serratia rubidaea]